MPKPTTQISIPASALVVLVGVAGSGKSTFANAHFRATEILSSDHFRAMVSDDAGDQEATTDAFMLLHLVLDKRLRRGKLCVVDATNLLSDHRAKLISLAHLYNRPTLAVIFDTPQSTSIERAGRRAERIVSASVIREQSEKMSRQSDADFLREGFQEVARIKLDDQVEIRRSMSAMDTK